MPLMIEVAKIDNVQGQMVIICFFSHFALPLSLFPLGVYMPL